MAALMKRMQSIAAPEAESQERIKVIRAGVGNTVRMIPVAEVVCFEATEKYVNVVTPTGEALVRMSLRELMARIDSTDFIQVHRSVMVNSNAIVSATRDENGHYSLAVRGLQRPLKVLDAALAGRDWLLGDAFSVADLNLASVMHLMKNIRFDYSAHTNVQRWADACYARPALARALARG